MKRGESGGVIARVAALGLASLALLAALQTGDAPLAAVRGVAPAAAVPDGLSASFDGTSYRFSGTVRDHLGHAHLLLFAVAEENLRRSREEYGFDRAALPAHLERAVRAFVASESARRGLDLEATVAAAADGSVDLRFRYRTRSEAERTAVKRLMADISAAVDEVRDEWYRGHGFVVEGDTVRPDFQWLKDRNTASLAGLRAQLEGVSDGDDRLALALAFCQRIPYVVEPMESGGRFTSGVLPPTEVVVEQHGDCDCKSVLFATLWAGPRHGDVILVDVPDHVFAAVRGRPRFATDTAFTLDGQPYLCVEPVGPGIVRAGQVAATSREHLRAGNYRLIPVS